MEADYAYDVFGNRNEKIVDADGAGAGAAVVSRFALDGWNPAKPTPVGLENFDVWAELDGGNALTTRYLRGDGVDQLFGRVSNGETNWTLTDNLGSVRDVIDGNGSLVKSVNFDAFGKITSQSGEGELGKYAWTGRELDAETGLQYNRARYYDSSTGRWISQDPMGFDAGDSNLYRYVNNKPTIATDPSGMQESNLVETVANTGRKENLSNAIDFKFGEGTGTVTVISNVSLKLKDSGKQVDNFVQLSFVTSVPMPKGVHWLQIAKRQITDEKKRYPAIAYPTPRAGKIIYAQTNRSYVDTSILDTAKYPYFGIETKSGLRIGETELTMFDRPGYDPTNKTDQVQTWLMDSYLITAGNKSIVYHVHWERVATRVDGEWIPSYVNVTGNPGGSLPTDVLREKGAKLFGGWRVIDALLLKDPIYYPNPLFKKN